MELLRIGQRLQKNTRERQKFVNTMQERTHSLLHMGQAMEYQGPFVV